MGAGGLALAGLALPAALARAAQPKTFEIRMRSSMDGGHVQFDPIGLYVPPGATIRWVIEANVHTTTAYHPENDDHSLRIPSGAAPWDSGYLVNPGDSFAVTLAVEGVYDYYCAPHEEGGMVGRIVVGSATGLGAQPFDYFAADPAKAHWRRVPEAARAAFPPLEEILARRVIPAPAG